jgi:hypothetical protein
VRTAKKMERERGRRRNTEATEAACFTGNSFSALPAFLPGRKHKPNQLREARETARWEREREREREREKEREREREGDREREKERKR